MGTAIFCVSILGLLVFGLGLGVSAQRGKTQTAAGYPDDPANPLYKWVRAHGNTVEYAPMLAILMLALGAGGPGRIVRLMMLVATVSRILFAIGVITGPTMAKAHPLRFIGATGTYLAGLVLSLALLFG